MSAQVARVDFSPFATLPLHEPLQHVTEAQAAAAAHVDAALRTHGVLHLCNVRVPEPQLQRMWQLSRQLFSLPLSHKLSRLQRLCKRTNYGYIAPGAETLNRQRAADLKEAYNFKNPAEYPLCFDGFPPHFERHCHQFYSCMAQIGRRFSVACALALGLPPNHLCDMLQRLDAATLRMIHYPPTPFERGVSTGERHQHAPIRVGEHTDYGLFTLLFCDARGLQVRAPHADQWLYVPPPPPGAVVVTVGALLARVSNDAWRATPHRVVVSDADVAARSRYSVAMFLDPDKRCVIEPHPSLIAPGEGAKYAPISSEAYGRARVHGAIND